VSDAPGRPAPPEGGGRAAGPPPLRPFGLVLHHDGRWSHEGEPILNRKLREKFDRSVVYLPDEAKYVVVVGHFRGEIEVEEAAFFVRSVDFETGEVALSDRSSEPLQLLSLFASPLDGALLCRVKPDLADDGLPARFSHAAQAELLGAVEEGEGGLRIHLGGEARDLPTWLGDDGADGD
jgi:hypothetical protein